MKSLLIDDLRTIDADVVARNFEAGIYALQNEGPFGVLFLDHDLGEVSETGTELWMQVNGENYSKNGYGIMCFLENNPHLKPVSIKLVTSNPVGRQKMQVVIDRLYKENV